MANSNMLPGTDSPGWGGAPGSGGGGGQNQYMTYPSLPNFNPTGGGSSYGPVAGGGPGYKPGDYWVGPGGRVDLGGNTFAAPTYDPQFTSSFYTMLQGMLGQSGGLQNNLLSFLQGGPSSMPGAGALASMANTGNPISALPEWQQMLDAQQRNISENQANLKEQFAFAGDLQSSPFGNAMTDFMTQTTKDQNALLAQLQTSALENAMGRELQAGQGIQGEAGAESQFLQQLLAGGALASPSIFTKSKTGGLSGLLGGIGSMLGGIGTLGGAAADAGGIGALFAGLI
jgi:hypothetical protein